MLALVEAGRRGAAARDLLASDPDWALPAHVPVEVLRTQRRYEEAGLLTARQASEHARHVAAHPARYVGPGPGLIAGVWAWRSAVVMYDAPYVYLAHELDVPLVTADLRLARAATAVGVRAVVPEDA